MQIFIETDRLLLREIAPSDYQAMFELDADPEVHKFLGNNLIENIEQAKQAIAFIRKQYVENGIGRWAMVTKEKNIFIGWAVLKLITTEINHHTNYYDLGYRLIRKFWGNGYATEAARASIAYGFNKLKLNEIYGMAVTENINSRHVLEKAGMRYIEQFNYKGLDHCWYKLSPSK
jgi:[ribosomal protein S5]-alanine N-acetyltransferase